MRLVAQRQAIMKDTWLGTIGHKRPEMRQGVSMTEARHRYDELETRIRALVK